MSQPPNQPPNQHANTQANTQANAQTKSMYDLVIRHLTTTPQGLAVSDAGLTAIATTLAQLQNDERLDALLGIMVALDFVSTQKNPEGAASSLLTIILLVLERTSTSEKQLQDWQSRAQKLVGQSASQSVGQTINKVLGMANPSTGAPASRPTGTVSAGPGARFAAFAQVDKQADKKNKP